MRWLGNLHGVPSLNKAVCRLRPPAAAFDPTGLIAGGAWDLDFYRDGS